MPRVRKEKKFFLLVGGEGQKARFTHLQSAANRSATGAETSPVCSAAGAEWQGAIVLLGGASKGQPAPWRAFGDFLREGKVTRGGGAERPPCGCWSRVAFANPGWDIVTRESKGVLYGIHNGKLSGGRHRRGARRHRGGAGGGAAGRQNRHLHHVARRHRQHALQPLDRRHRQGPPGAGDRRAGRRDGQGGGRHLPAEPDAQPGQGPGGAQPARPVGPRGLPPRDEAPAGKAEGPGHHPGGDLRHPSGRERRG